MAHAEKCPTCKGTGKITRTPTYTTNIKEICMGCGGRGWVEVGN